MGLASRHELSPADSICGGHTYDLRLESPPLKSSERCLRVVSTTMIWGGQRVPHQIY